jgi:hypothetical protein
MVDKKNLDIFKLYKVSIQTHVASPHNFVAVFFASLFGGAAISGLNLCRNDQK